MTQASFFTFFVAITLLTITPGVDTLLVIRNTTRGGWWDGAVSSLGICSALFVHATISALGISIILVQAAWIFGLIKLAGAFYLVWLGLASLRKLLSKETFTLSKEELATRGAFSPVRSYREGFLSNILNPKAVVFYMAFLPQFITPEQSPLVQSCTLAGIHFLIAMIWQCLLALLVEQFQVWLQSPRVSRAFDATTGTVLVGLGLKIAADQ